MSIKDLRNYMDSKFERVMDDIWEDKHITYMLDKEHRRFVIKSDLTIIEPHFKLSELRLGNKGLMFNCLIIV